MSRMVLLSFLLIAALMPIPARAAMDPAGVATLTALFSKYLEERKAAARLNGQELRAEGKILVEPGSNYYAVTLPHLSSHQPDGSYTDIGIIAINAVPGNDKDTWKMTVAAPTPIIAYDAQKQPNMRIDIGAQSFNGLWHNTLENFQKLDVKYKDVTLQEFSQGITAKIPLIGVVYDINPGPRGWSGKMTYNAETITVTAKGDPGISKIAKVLLDSSVTDFNPADLKSYRKKIAAIGESQRAAAPGTISDDHVQGLYNLIADFMGSAVGQFDSRLTISGVDLHRPAIPGSPPGKLMIHQAVFSMGGKGFRDNNVTSRATLGFDGLSITPAPAGLGEVIPNRMSMDIELSKIPFTDLMELGRQSLKTPDAAQQAAIRQALTKAGSTMKINPSHMGNSTYAITLNGQMIANIATAIGANGTARAEITGMNNLVALAQSRIKDKTVTATEKQKLAGIAMGLTTLQMMGQQDKTTPGKDVRIYNIEFTADGKIMLNGNDLAAVQALMGMGAPKAP